MEDASKKWRRAVDSAALRLLAAAAASLLFGCVAELAHLAPAQIHSVFNSMGIYVLVYYLVLRRIATPAFGALVLVASLVALCVGYYGLAWLMQGGGRPFFFVVWCAVGILLAPVMSYLVHCSTMLERKSGLAAGFIAGIFVGEILVGSFFFGDPTNNILMFAIDVLGVLVVLRLAKATRINLFHTVCGVVIATSLYLGGIELLRLVTGTIRP